MINMPEPGRKLSTRARNVIYHLLVPDLDNLIAQGKWQCFDIDPRQVAQLCAVDVLRMPNAGLKTLQNIQDWLVSYGLELSKAPRCPHCGGDLHPLH